MTDHERRQRAREIIQLKRQVEADEVERQRGMDRIINAAFIMALIAMALMPFISFLKH